MIKIRNIPNEAIPEFMKEHDRLKEEFIGCPDKEETYIQFKLEVEHLQQQMRHKYASENIVILAIDEKKYQPTFLNAQQIAELHSRYFPDTHEYNTMFTSSEVLKMLKDLDTTDIILDCSTLPENNNNIFNKEILVDLKSDYL